MEVAVQCCVGGPSTKSETKGKSGLAQDRKIFVPREIGLQDETHVLMMVIHTGLYTDESPGLKVDPVVVFVLSLGFIFSVVALHGT